MIKKMLIIALVLFSVIVINAQDSETRAEKIERYNDYAYNTYMILIGIFILGAVSTLIMVSNHYGLSHLKNILIGVFITVILIYLIIRFNA